jgi:hypothetical protein
MHDANDRLQFLKRFEPLCLVRLWADKRFLMPEDQP